MKYTMLQAYEYIINHENFVICMDCDSTVITSSFDTKGHIMTTGEGLSDVAIALGRRIGKPYLYKEVDKIAQVAMSYPGSVFEDSLDARLKILIEHGLKREDVENGAKKAQLAPGFSEYIHILLYLEEQVPLGYNRFYFLSGGFYEMLIHAISQTMDAGIAGDRIFSNYFLYEGERVTGWDRHISRMYMEDAKKIQVARLRQSGDIPKDIKVSGLGDGSNDTTMSDTGLFVAYTGTKRREQVVEKACGVEVENFYEALVLHSSPTERGYIMNHGPQEFQKILKKGIQMLEKRVQGISIL